MDTKKRLGVNLDPELVRRVKIAAIENDASLTDMVETALEGMLAVLEKKKGGEPGKVQQNS